MAPRYERSNVFDAEGLVGVTTNSFIAQNNRLVMGRGAALALSKREPEFPFRAGQAIKNICGHLGRYGWLVVSNGALNHQYGIFQVKYHWRDEANLDLIRFSVDKLNEWVNAKKRRVAINFPGIGNGRRQVAEVFTIIDQLDSRVTVHYFEDRIEAELRRLAELSFQEVPF